MDGKEKSLAVFQGKKIRRVWHKGEWWFVLEDIIQALTDSSDTKQYIQKMKQRDEPLSQGWVQIVHTLPVQTSGGTQSMNCVKTEGAFRIIQSIPSPKAEPFKLWLAQVGYERVQEIENPELAQDRARKYYELKGYPREWIEKRLRGIAIRQELTEEWKAREVNEEREFAILTDEISKATFDLTTGEHKKVKQLDVKRKNQNLRDHMTDLELIFTMLGEKATTEITKAKGSKGLPKCMESAKEGGSVAGNARMELERKTGKKVVSTDNYLDITNKRKKLK
ncbi:Bro-N domain-containing protein [Candidatus Woesearchaeota archaeon]|nr:Bro-N domain-containing protein [Candidatus Woesearchaeota archaeon]